MQVVKMRLFKALRKWRICIMSNQYEERVKREWEKLVNETHYPNIMLLGVTGCGKVIIFTPFIYVPMISIL